MVDDSWDVETYMEFHPCDIPYGMTDYVLADLTHHQQSKLNLRKRDEIRTNQQYLANHPEIRGLVSMILRILMRTRPIFDVYEVIGQYFTKSSVDLKEEVYAYIEQREDILADNSIMMDEKTILSASTFTDLTAETDEDIALVDEIEAIRKKELEDEREKDKRGIIWSTDHRDGDRESVSSAVKICQNVLEDIVMNVIEEIDALSVGSIASVGFPVDYEDHAISSSDDSTD